MANELMPKNLNMLRHFAEYMTPEERRKMMLMGGDVEPDFATQVAMLNQQGKDQYATPDRQMPFQASLMGNSGGYNVQLPNGQTIPFMPEMMQGRMGYQGDNLRAGALGQMVRLPDGTIKMMPIGLDAGYNADLGNSSNLDIGGMYGPRGMFNVNARYSKKF
jgi:hypothetical protein